jgi:hypothetical protein
MPGRDHPEDFSKGVFTILHDERDQPPTDKAYEAVLFWVVVALVFHIGQGEQLVELGEVNVAPLEDLLLFCNKEVETMGNLGIGSCTRPLRILSCSKRG